MDLQRISDWQADLCWNICFWLIFASQKASISLKPLPEDKILDWSKLKQIADVHLKWKKKSAI